MLVDNSIKARNLILDLVSQPLEEILSNSALEGLTEAKSRNHQTVYCDWVKLPDFTVKRKRITAKGWFMMM